MNIIRRTLGAWIVQRVDFLAAYQCTVVSQNGDGSLELQPDDSRLPPYSHVPIRYGVPGVSAQVAAGSRVLLEFASADPQKPIATVWESSSVTQLNVTATTVNINGTTVNVSATTVNVGGSSSTQVNLGPGPAYQLVARMSDPVVAGPFAGSILVPAQLAVKA